MQALHADDHLRLCTGFAIATPHDAAPWHVADAILAYRAVAHEHGLCAEQTEIVQRLHYRHALLVGGEVQRWRNQREGIVHMDHVGPELPDAIGDFRCSAARPDGINRHLQRRSEGSRVGKECVSKCRYRWSAKVSTNK